MALFFPRATASSAPCWFSLNWTRSFYYNCPFSHPTTVFFPVASGHCCPAFTCFISAALTHPAEKPCSICFCSSGCFHAWPWGNFLPLCLWEAALAVNQWLLTFCLLMGPKKKKKSLLTEHNFGRQLCETTISLHF